MRMERRQARRELLREAIGRARHLLGPGYPSGLPSYLNDAEDAALTEVTRLGVIIGPAEYNLTVKLVEPIAFLAAAKHRQTPPDPAWHADLKKSLEALSSRVTLTLGPRKARREARRGVGWRAYRRLGAG
jgi:hypothetical protein